MQTMNRIIIKVSGEASNPLQDLLAIEEPLQIQLNWNGNSKNIAVTMRTPGDDVELAAGFLFTEGVIKTRNQISQISNGGNNVVVALNDGENVSLQNTERNFYATSSCGVCGKASIDALKTVSVFTNAAIEEVGANILYALPNVLKEKQQVFKSTGGLHAAALFSLDGNIILLKEDVGRHNALDKLIGHALLNNMLPLYDKILLLSGRASFELIQKAAMAGIQIVAAIGAPSSLAVHLAEEKGITLIGFLRQDAFNIYCNGHRIKASKNSA